MSAESPTGTRVSLRASVRAGGAVTIAAAAMLLPLVAEPAHRAASAAADPSQPGAPTAIVVCVASDGIMHAAGVTGSCASGQTSMRLTPSTSEGDNGNPWNPQAESDTASPASVDLPGQVGKPRQDARERTLV